MTRAIDFIQRLNAAAVASGIRITPATGLVLTVSLLLAVVGGMVFFVTAGTLSGRFYLTTAAYFATAVAMACLPSVEHLLFGAVSAVSFFVPGLKYYRLRQRTAAAVRPLTPGPAA